MTATLVVLAATVTFLAIWHAKGPATATFLAVLAACALTTFDIFGLGDAGVITAMAPPVLTFATFNLALVGGLLALPRLVLRNIPPWFMLFLIFVLAITIFRGLSSVHTLSGVAQWLSVVVAWGLGGAVAQFCQEDGLPTQRLVAVAVAAVIGWQAVIAGMQMLGVRAVGAIDVGGVEVARASGLAGHSGNLGKILFFLIAILLPLTRSSDKVARRAAVAAIALAAVLTGITFSRANTLAVVLAIGLWVILSPGIALAKRILIPIAGLVVALPIIDVLILRNEYDPDGGSRPLLTETAYRQISETLWLGVGPNNYLNYVGQFDPLAAGGLPVHSAFLLALAELGLLCSVLLLIPFAQALLQSFRSFAGKGESRLYAASLLAVTPGLILIGATGWGLLREQYLILMFFTVGYLVRSQTSISTNGDALVIGDKVKGKSRTENGTRNKYAQSA